MKLSLLRRPTTSVIAGVTLVLGCGAPTGTDPVLEAGRERAAGTYVLTKLIGTEAGVSTDFFAKGVRATIVLSGNGRTSGRFTAPLIEGEEDTPFDLDLVGTFSVRGNDVSFQHEADTFFRDAPWRRHGDELRTTFPGIDAVLERR